MVLEALCYEHALVCQVPLGRVGWLEKATSFGISLVFAGLCFLETHMVRPLKINMSPKKRPYWKGSYIHLPDHPFSAGHVSFREGNRSSTATRRWVWSAFFHCHVAAWRVRWFRWAESVQQWKTPWLFGVFVGDEMLTQLCGDSFINHEIRIPIKQPGFDGKSQGAVEQLLMTDPGGVGGYFAR